MSDNYIIDSHSHFGKDNFWKNIGSDLEYMQNASSVNEVFAMSVPCPVIIKPDGTKSILSYYELDNGNVIHYRVDEKQGKKKYIQQLYNCNPYKEANDYIYELSKKNKYIKFNYVPIIHPYYYSYDDFVEHINRGAKIFKIHGIACGVIPSKIEEEFLRLLEYLKIPIIIHTDYSKEENILSYNSAKNWINILNKYDIKVYFAHAARLNKYSIDFINADNRYVVGIGPDKLLSIDEQNECNVKDYLSYCFEQFDIEKLIFDIDYPWNIQNYSDYNFDWDSINRILVKQLTNNEKNKILSKNIQNFIKER